MSGVKGQIGGNRKSVELLKLHGTYREDRHGKIQPPVEFRERIVPQDHVVNPDNLPDPEQVFSYFADELERQGMSQKIDSILISQLSEAYYQYCVAVSYARSSPDAMFGKKLASQVALDHAREIRHIMAEFRLTPTARGMSEPKKEKNEPEDLVGQFLEARIVNP